MTTDEGIKYDRSLLGVEHPIGTFDVTKKMIVGFARSTGETDTKFIGTPDGTGEVVAPSTICNIFVNGDSLVPLPPAVITLSLIHI